MDPQAYLDNNKQNRLNELFAFLRFPSVSGKSEYTNDVLACAGWLSSHLNDMGIDSQVLPTGGHPVHSA